jgi:hypothetical protein
MTSKKKSYKSTGRMLAVIYKQTRNCIEAYVVHSGIQNKDMSVVLQKVLSFDNTYFTD